MDVDEIRFLNFNGNRINYVVLDGVDRHLPGIYEWQIEGLGSYIGRYKKISRPEKHYARNVRRLIAGLPYRKQKPKGFRYIHEQLAQALKEGRNITLRLLENPPVTQINLRERQLIAERGTLNRI